MADGANRNDCTLLEPTLAAAQQRGLLADIETLHLRADAEAVAAAGILSDQF